MIECIFCQDWARRAKKSVTFHECHLPCMNQFHDSCIYAVDKPDDEDFVCSACHAKYLKELSHLSCYSDSPAKDFFLPSDWIEKYLHGKDSECCKRLYHEILIPDEKVLALEIEDTSNGDENGMFKSNECSKIQNYYIDLLKMLSSMDRVKAIHCVEKYNVFVGKLKEYLKDFAVNGKDVTREDIDKFITENRQ